YFFHLLSLAMAFICIALLIIWLIFYDLIQQARKGQSDFWRIWDNFRKRVYGSFLCTLPVLFLVIITMYPKGKLHSGFRSFDFSLDHLMKFFWGPLISFCNRGSGEVFFYIALVLFVAVIFIFLLVSKLIHRQVHRWDGILLVAVVYAVIWFIVPKGIIGGGYITYRVSLFSMLVTILWFGTGSFRQRAKLWIQTVAVGISLVLLGTLTVKCHELNDYFEEFFSGMHFIKPGKVLLPMYFSHEIHTPDGRSISPRIRVFGHATGYIAAEKHIIELHNYEAKKDWFPMKFHEDLNPYIHIKSDRQPTTASALRSYCEKTGVNVDYVLVWGEEMDRKETKRHLKQLEGDYELIYTSPQRGLMKLYRLRDFKE
ncbi:phage holin family protein, partial [Patescibacteria group bacterium]|nr:phage holin family protein [Patescibacteria group bacterium]